VSDALLHSCQIYQTRCAVSVTLLLHRHLNAHFAVFRQRLQPAGNHRILTRDLGADDVKFWVSCTGLALPNQQEGTRSCPASTRVLAWSVQNSVAWTGCESCRRLHWWQWSRRVLLAFSSRLNRNYMNECLQRALKVCSVTPANTRTLNRCDGVGESTPL